MDLNGSIYTFSKELKLLFGAFIIVLSIGFYSGLLFVEETSSINPSGIEEQYLGNEFDDEAMVMKFKKSKREMLTLVHNHILSMSIIFVLLGLITLTTKLNRKLKLVLVLEPFLSIILTFGGLYFLWLGVLWFKYVVIVSGILMTICFTISVLVILKQLFIEKS